MPKWLANVWDETCCPTLVSGSSDDDSGGSDASCCEREFETVAAMLASDTTIWREAWCQNYTGLDGIITEWFKTTNPAVLPNGSDILQASDGGVLVRRFLRENTGTEISIPNPSGTPYVVTVPVAYPTIADMQAGTEATQMVGVMSDANGDGALFKLGGSAPDDGHQSIVNAVGIHYTRIVLT